jgi:hypothetical protein
MRNDTASATKSADCEFDYRAGQARSAGGRRVLFLLVFLSGFAVWTGVQTVFVAVPLWTRALPPEVDDSLTYVLKTRQMQECFFQDCPALNDLRRQFHSETSDREVIHQRELAGSRLFPIYHPLLSLVLLGMERLGFELMTAYKILWTAGPCLFGLAFAFLLASVWGLPAAGITLGLLAFKVFPDTGLHHVVPSNIALAMASLMWARVISRNGDAPWSLILGSVALVAMHPVGLIYSVTGVIFAFSLTGFNRRVRTWLPVCSLFGLFIISFTGSTLFGNAGIADLFALLKGRASFGVMVSGAAQTLATVIVQTVRLKEGLFGFPPLFCGAVVLGFLVLTRECRRKALRITMSYFFILSACFFYASSHPGDLILRMWIPLIVIVSGAVGNAVWYLLLKTREVLIRHGEKNQKADNAGPAEWWPVVVLAIMIGYCLQMAALGGEQVIATADHIKNRQPLALEPTQPELLLSRAKPGDQVLYTSMIIMPYYFIQGAMKLGAIYYHPSMKNTPSILEWLGGKELRFAVTYNPMVYHPSFEGLDETDWWITAPDYHYSDLSRRRRNQPVSREGEILSADFLWIEIAPKCADLSGTLRMRVHNTGKSSRAQMIPIDRTGALLTDFQSEVSVSAGLSGWVEWDVSRVPQGARFRIVFPNATSAFRVGGLVFDSDELHWPWAQKATLTFAPREATAGPITVSFDPATLLPQPLNGKAIHVLNDAGSSVLLEVGGPGENYP